MLISKLISCSNTFFLRIFLQFYSFIYFCFIGGGGFISLVDWENRWQNLQTSLWGLYIHCSWVQISDSLCSSQPIGDELRSESPHFAGINRGQLSVAAHLPYTIHRRYTSFQRSSWTKSFLQFIRRETDTDPKEENFLLFVALSAMAILVQQSPLYRAYMGGRLGREAGNRNAWILLLMGKNT